MVDRAANGRLAGSDMRILQKTGRKLNVVGIGNHELTGLDVVIAACPFQSSSGKVVGIFSEYAYLGKGSSNHSPGQMEVFKTQVHDKSIKVGEQAEEDREKGTRLVTLKKSIHVINYVVNYGGNKFTCSTPSSLSSFCRIPFMLGKLKIELTKNPLYHAGKNGEHPWGKNLYNDVENWEYSSEESFHGNNTKMHIKSHYTWQIFKIPCSLDDNQHMDTLLILTATPLTVIRWLRLPSSNPSHCHTK